MSVSDERSDRTWLAAFRLLRNSLWLLNTSWLGVVLAMLAAGYLAADEVVYVDTQGQTIRREGDVQRYNLERLLLVSPTGAKSRIPAERVVAVTTGRVAAHRQGRRYQRDRKFAAALASYREAYREERRDWVRQELIAHTIECLTGDGNVRKAIATYLSLLAHDPATRFRHVIPVPWRPATDARFENEARGWLADEAQPPAATLIAASWLLSGSHRKEADQALQRLARNGTERANRDLDWVAMLATAQRWRLRTVTVEPDEVESWRQHFDRMPDDLKAGPAFVFAQALARQRQIDDAVLAYLQVLWGDTARVDLAGDALWNASQLLQQVGRGLEAKRLLNELVAAYPESPHTTAAVDQIERLP